MKKISSNVTQKQALEQIIEKYFNEKPIKEQSFSWSENKQSLPMYKTIYEVLKAYRGHDFITSKTRKRRLCFDYFVPSKNLLIEYDERQHFSVPRAIAISHYPRDITTCFDIDKWKELANTIKARDNDPIYRDEQRAYFDSIRDLAATTHGYKVIRIYHKDIDWEADDAYEIFDDYIRKSQI